MERALVAMLRAGRGTALSRMRHVVCTMRESGPLSSELESSVELISLNVRGVDRFAAVRLARVIARLRPDIVHARNGNTWGDTLMAIRLSRVARSSPVPVLAFHGFESVKGFVRRHRRVERWFKLSTCRFTTVSQSGAAFLRDELGVEPGHVTLLPNGVDTDYYRPNPAQRERERGRLGFGKDCCVIVMVGSLVPAKDYGNAINAFANRRAMAANVRLVIAGEGPLRPEVEALIAERDLSAAVHLAGQHRNVVELLRAADIFWQSSRNEQMSNALLEAMAVGLPVVVTDVGDNARIVADGVCGRIVPARNCSALSRASMDLAADSDLRRRMGQAARDIACRRYSDDVMVRRYADYYASILESRREARPRCAALPV